MMDDPWSLLGSNVSWSVVADNATECPPELTAAMHSALVFKYFGECVMNVRQWFAFVIGMLSIACWLVAQVPQLVTNCRTGKGDEALSFWFLMLWIFGDSTNLIGAIFSKQLGTEIATAVYYLLLDFITMSQYLFYVIKNQGCDGLASAFLCKSNKKQAKRNSAVLSLLLPLLVSSVFLAAGAPYLTLYQSQQLYHTPAKAGRTLLWDKRIIDVDDKLYVTGYIFGVFSAGFYVFARVPQIVKNFMRCSVEGLSVHMFILSVLGNVTYGLGILLYSVDGIFLLQKLPWLVGSLGTMVFDIIIITHIFVSKTCGTCRTRAGADVDHDDCKPLLGGDEDVGGRGTTAGLDSSSAASEEKLTIRKGRETVQINDYGSTA